MMKGKNKIIITILTVVIGIVGLGAQLFNVQQRKIANLKNGSELKADAVYDSDEELKESYVSNYNADGSVNNDYKIKIIAKDGTDLSKYIDFDAYFLDKDNNNIKRRGIYKIIEDKDRSVGLNVHLGVSQDAGSLMSCKLYLNPRINGKAQNRNYTAISTYDGQDVTLIDDDTFEFKNNMSSGNAIDMKNIRLDCNIYTANGQAYKSRYSNVNTIRLEGTYIDKDGKNHEFSTDVELIIDWDAKLRNIQDNNFNISNSIKIDNIDYCSIVNNKIVAVMKVESCADGDELALAICKTAKYEIKGFKIDGKYSPENIKVVSGLYNYANKEIIDYYNYDKENDILTFSNSIDKSGEGAFNENKHISYVEVTYNESDSKAIQSKANNTAFSTEINAKVCEMEWVNPKIQHYGLDNNSKMYKYDLGTNYTSYANTSTTFEFKNFTGYVYSANTRLKNINKGNTLAYYEDDTTKIVSGFAEEYRVNVFVSNYVKGIKIKKDNSTFSNKNTVDNVFVTPSADEKSEKYTNMKKYIEYTGIEIGEESVHTLGEDGWIRVIDGDTNAEIAKYYVDEEKNSETDKKFTAKHFFANSASNVILETSPVVQSGEIVINYNVEINNEELKKDITYNQFKKFEKIASSANVYIKVNNSYDEKNPYPVGNKADYIDGLKGFITEKAISLNTYDPTKIDFKVETTKENLYHENSEDACLNNADIYIEFPKVIKQVEINSIDAKIGNESIRTENIDIEKNIVNKKTGNIYCKIRLNGKNYIQEKALILTMKLNLTPNTSEILNCKGDTEKIGKINTYLFNTYDGTTYLNEKNENWMTVKKDEGDWNNNGDTEEYIPAAYTNINITNPAGLGTTVSAKSENNEVVCPDKLKIEKGTKTVTIKDNFYNYLTDSEESKSTINNLKLIGRIPYKGNKYMISGDSMNSEFNTTMTSDGITILDDSIKNNVTVYYSANENKTISSYTTMNQIILDFSSWDWKTKDQVTDWSSIKTYMITVNGNIPKGTHYSFSYTLNLPNDAVYDTIAYTSNAIAYTDYDGKLWTVESSPVGIKFESNTLINLNLAKVDKDNHNKKVYALYELTRADENKLYSGESSEQYTFNNKNVKIENLSPETLYILKEIDADKSYKKENIKFTILRDGTITYTGEEGYNGKINIENSTEKTDINQKIITLNGYIEDPLNKTDYAIHYLYSENDDITNAVEDSTLKETYTGIVGNTINNTTKINNEKTLSQKANEDEHLKKGYKFVKIQVLDENGKEKDLPLSLSENSKLNQIKVYYKKLSYKYQVKYYYDGDEDSDKLETKTAFYGTEISNYPTEGKDKDGYEFEKAKALGTDGNEKDLPLVISDNLATNIINVYYKSKTYNYSIKYYYDGNEDTSLEVNASATFGSQIKSYTPHVKTGFKLEKTENCPLTITSGENVMKIYYVTNGADYKIKYYYDGSLDTSKTETLSATIGSKISTYQGKCIDGYKFQKARAVGTDGNEKTSDLKTDPLVITNNVETNVINVYYVKNSYNYSIHYYYSGQEDTSKTETKSAVFGSFITSYPDKNITGYKFSKSTTLPIVIGSNSSRNRINVYYVKDSFEYKVHYFYDGVEDTSKIETKSAVYGSTVKTITAKNKTGYKFEKTENLPLTISEKASQNNINVYYVKNTYEYSVHYFYDGVENPNNVDINTALFEDEISTFDDKVTTGYKFEKVKALNSDGNEKDLPLKIGTDKTKNIINVYYVKENYEYTVRYYYDGVEDTTKRESYTAQYGAKINNYTDKVITGYKFVKTTGKPLTITTDKNKNIIRVYYVKNSFNYSVHYYYDGVENKDNAYTKTAKYNSEIKTFTDKNITGYKLEKTIGLPLTIGVDETKNIIKVYYVKDDYAYLVKYYYDNIEDTSKREPGTAKFGSIISNYEDKVIDGYKLQKTENLPLTIGTNVDNNIIKIYYIKDSYNYTVHYFYDGKENTEKTVTAKATFDSEIRSYTDKNITGYKFEKTENFPLRITSDASKNKINVYYVKDSFEYTVHYFYNGVEDTTRIETATSKFGSTISTYKEKLIDGYKKTSAKALGTDGKEKALPLTITSDVSKNKINVYYVKDSYNYTVHYFYNGVENADKKETKKAEFGTIISTYTDKNIDGYKLERKENIPLTITSDVSKNNINIYYVKDSFEYTVHYFYNGAEDTTRTETGKAGFGSNVSTYKEKLIDGYKKSSAKALGTDGKEKALPLTITSDSSKNRINVYYVKDSYDYSVHYFYDGKEDTTKTVTNSAKFGSSISSYTDKNIAGYKFEKTENLPLTITSDASKNKINVYYVKDSFEYTVHYFYDGIEDTSKIETKSATYGSEIKTYTDKAITGYKKTNAKALGTDGKEKDLPLTITADISKNKINVYYVKDSYDYTVHYFYDGKEDTSKVETAKAIFDSEIKTYKNKNIDGYRFEKTENLPLKITADASKNKINVYYVKDSFEYTVHYFYDGIEDTTKIETAKAVFGNTISTYKEKLIDGYKKTSAKALGTDGKEKALPLTITADANKNKINVYYVKDKFKYTVHYYYEGKEDNSKVEEHEAEFKSKIKTYTNKVIVGYRLDKTENLPLEITSNANENIINIYYVRDIVDYKVEYYYQVNGEYNIFNTDTLKALAESTINASVINKESKRTDAKYVYSHSNPDPSTTTVKVAADGSTVIKVYFNQKIEIEFVKGTHGTFDTQKYTIDYNTAGSFKGTPTGEDGYQFTGWDIDPTIPVKKNTTYTAQWKAIPVNYKVEYYYQEKGKYPTAPNGGTVTRQGLTDTNVSLEANDYVSKKNGYIYDTTANNVTTAVIKGNGSTVLKAYFKQQFTVKFEPGTKGTFETETQTGINYGDKATRPSANTDKAHQPGYTFNTWKNTANVKNANPENVVVTADETWTALWTANTNTKYKVEYYYQVNGAYNKTPTDSVVRAGTTDTIASVTSADKKPNANVAPTGTYVFDGDAGNILSANINGDESTVLKVYFKQQFKVTYLPGTKGTFEKEINKNIDYGSKTPAYGGEITGAPGYTWSGWNPNIVDTVTKDMTYTAQWTPNPNTKYAVQYYYEIDGTYPSTPYDQVVRTGTTDTLAKVTEDDEIPKKTDANYIFDSKNPNNVLEHNIDGTGEAILKVYFKEIPVNYDVNVTLKNSSSAESAIGGGKFTIARSSTKDANQSKVYEGVVAGVVKNVEVTERKVLIDNYSYYIMENEAPTAKYTNILSGKYVKANIKISAEGKIALDSAKPFQIYYNNGTLVEDSNTVHKYVKVSLGTSINNVPSLNIDIINPVTYTLEVDKVQTDGEEIKNTEISIGSSVTGETVTKTTDGNGSITYDEAEVTANTYTYEINEETPAGAQYVNVLKNCYIEIKVTVNPNGTLSLTKYDVNGKKYSFILKDKNTKKAITNYGLYDYVTVAVDNTTNTIKSIISTSIINPVQYNVDMRVTDSGFVSVEDNNPVLPNTNIKIYREDVSEAKYDGKVKIDDEFNESPIKAGTYKYYFTQTSKSNGSVKYCNPLEGKYIKVIAKVEGNGRVSLMNGNTEDNSYFEVYSGDISSRKSTDKRITDENVLKYIHTGITTLNNVSTIRAVVENPAQFQIDIAAKNSTGKDISGINYTIRRNDNTIRFNGEVTTDIEDNESPINPGKYVYYITQNNKVDNRHINVLENKFIKLTVTVNNDGTISVDKVELFEGSPENNDAKALNISNYKDYISISLENNSDKTKVSLIKVSVLNPIKFTVEVNKEDTANNPLANTGIEISSPIIEQQEHNYNNTEITGVNNITNDGVVEGRTDESGQVSYEETYVKSNTYTYEIRETATAGNQYVNILDGYKIVVKVTVNEDGTLTLVKVNNRNFEIVAIQDGKNVTEDLYKHVNISIDDGRNAITATLKAVIENPVQYKMDLKVSQVGTDGVLSPVNYEVSRSSETNTTKSKIFDGIVTENVEILESPMDANIYTYYIKQKDKVSSKYVNPLENKLVKIKAKVEGDGKVTLINANNQVDNTYFEVWTADGNSKVTDENVLKYISFNVSSKDSIYTINMNVENPIQYELDINPIDTNDVSLAGINFKISRQNERIFEDYATKNVEVTESPIDPSEYTYYIEQLTNPIVDGKQIDRYINVLENKKLKVVVKTDKDGKLTIKEVVVLEKKNDSYVAYDSNYFKDHFKKYINVKLNNNDDNTKMTQVQVTIKSPIRFKMEVVKKDAASDPLADTGIEISSEIIKDQENKYDNEQIAGIDSINKDGTVAGTTEKNTGKVSYEETWVDANDKKADFYTYRIKETKTAGKQYVNILDGKEIVIRVHVNADGTLVLVNSKGKAYDDSEENKFTIEDADGKVYNELCKYVKVSIINGSVETTINTVATEIKNPVRYNLVINGWNTADPKQVLKGTKFKVIRKGVSEATYTSSDDSGIFTKEESPMDAGLYTYYIDETNIPSQKYVNPLRNAENGDKRYIKLNVKVSGDGTVTLLDKNSKPNDSYFEVHKGDINNVKDSDPIVTDANVLKYLSIDVSSKENVYTIKLDITNAVQYDIDLDAYDTADEFIEGIKFTVNRVQVKTKLEEQRYNKEVVEDRELLEQPIDAGTYEYYITQNNKKSTKYINVLEDKFIKITVDVADNGVIKLVKKQYFEGNINEKDKAVELKADDPKYIAIEKYVSIWIDNNANDKIDRINVKTINPVQFIMEIDKIDSEEHPLEDTGIEVVSPIINEQDHKFQNEEISGITEIDKDGKVTGNTKNFADSDSNKIKARVSYEETLVNAGIYRYSIKETKTAGAQYVNILENKEVIIYVKVAADGNLSLVASQDGTEFAKDAKHKFIIVDSKTKAVIPANTEDDNDLYTYVNVEVNNNKLVAVLNSQFENPVRYNIAVHETIYGKEKVALANIPVQIESGFSGDTVLTTDNNGMKTMEESPVRANTYKYYITQLNKYKNNVVSDKYINKLDGYMIGIDLYVPGDGDIKTISKDGDYTTVSYRIYRKNDKGDLEEVDFDETKVDDFVKVKVNKDKDNVCTLNIYIITPEKYNFKVMNTDIDLKDKYPEIARLNGTKFDITTKDEDEKEIQIINARSDFDTINTKGLITSNINGEDGLISLNDILVERAGTFTFTIHETTPDAKGEDFENKSIEGLIYKDKSEDVVIRYSVVVENGTYVIKDFKIIKGLRYTISENTGIDGNETETQTVQVNISDERIKGSYDLVINKYNKYTKKLLDGAVFKITVEQGDNKNKVIYYADGDVLSKNQILPYDGSAQNNNMMITNNGGVLTLRNIRIEIPGKYTIKIEELEAPNTFTKLDDIIVLDIETGIDGKYDDAEYILKNVDVNDEDNHNLVSAENSKHKINLKVENEYFDLAIRQYVTSVNGVEIKDRSPEIDAESFINGDATTAVYNQKKSAQRAYAGQEIIYTLTVYNEGIIDGFAQEITEYLPEGLEFVDDEFNKVYDWNFDEENNKVVTGILSKEKSNVNIIKAFDGDNIYAKTIKLKLKVSDDVKLKSKLTTIVEITDSLAENRKQTLDRDSRVDNVNVPEGKELAGYKDDELDNKYIPGDEDDDDFEKLIIEEFDLTTVKYLKKLNNEEQKDYYPQIQLDKSRIEEYKQGIFNGFKYKNEEISVPKVKQNDSLIFGIRAYNEGSVISYAEEIIDKIPDGMIFVIDSEINKKYEWKLLDENKQETTDVNKAVYVVTNYLSKEKNIKDNAIKALTIQDSQLNIDYKEVEVEFKIVNNKQICGEVVNESLIEKFDDDEGLIPFDRDDKNKDGKDDDGSIEDGKSKVYIKKFDMRLDKTVDSIIKRTTVNGKTTEEVISVTSDLTKVDIAKSKLKKTTLEVKYNITATNEGETSGYVMAVADYMPEGFTFVSELNPNWVERNGRLENTELADKLLQPGESATITITLRCDKVTMMGQVGNRAEIIDDADENKQEVCDYDSVTDNLVEGEDDLSTGVLLITAKTGSAEFAMVCIILSGLIIATIIIVKKKSNNK